MDEIIELYIPDHVKVFLKDSVPYKGEIWVWNTTLEDLTRELTTLYGPLEVLLIRGDHHDYSFEIKLKDKPNG